MEAMIPHGREANGKWQMENGRGEEGRGDGGGDWGGKGPDENGYTEYPKLSQKAIDNNLLG
jgi:hypothetical protein